ncbi:heterogeneous nuclear ribonucleoprotein A3 homolog 2 [Anabrus simplex]|uniref:heterogeneous nuclear ribonucleoprotein A3 homolog 2 n=1 Tax=Anabrus simplex TaxID=316456 RepID=UPI0034DD2AB8
MSLLHYTVALMVIGTAAVVLAGSGGGDHKHVHFKIYVPKFINKRHHTKTVFVHVGGGGHTKWSPGHEEVEDHHQVGGFGHEYGHGGGGGGGFGHYQSGFGHGGFGASGHGGFGGGHGGFSGGHGGFSGGHGGFSGGHGGGHEGFGEHHSFGGSGGHYGGAGHGWR